MSTIALREIRTSENIPSEFGAQFEPIARWYRARPTQVAFVASLMLHALLIALIPGFRSVPLDTPVVLTVQIVTEDRAAVEPALEPQPVVRDDQPLPQPVPDLLKPAPPPRVIEQPLVQPRPVLEPQPLPALREPEVSVMEPVARAELAPMVRRELPQVRPIITRRPELAPAQPSVPLVETPPVTDIEVPVHQTPEIIRQPRNITQAPPPVQIEPRSDVPPPVVRAPQVAPSVVQAPPPATPVARAPSAPPLKAPSPQPTQVAPPLAAAPVQPTSPTAELTNPAPVAPVVRQAPSRPVQATAPQAIAPVQPMPPSVAPMPAPVVASPIPPAPVLEAVAPSVLEAYRQSVSQEIMRHMLYPRIAVMRKWQGKTVVEMQLSDDGSVTHMMIAESSGKKVLDDAALKMVKQSLPLPKPPRGVRTVKVPVVFRLQG